MDAGTTVAAAAEVAAAAAGSGNVAAVCIGAAAPLPYTEGARPVMSKIGTSAVRLQKWGMALSSQAALFGADCHCSPY